VVEVTGPFRWGAAGGFIFIPTSGGAVEVEKVEVHLGHIYFLTGRRSRSSSVAALEKKKENAESPFGDVSLERGEGREIRCAFFRKYG